MGNKYSDRGLRLDLFERNESIILEKPGKEVCEKLGIDDVEKFMAFEDSIENRLDEFEPIEKFGVCTKNILSEIYRSDKPLTVLQKQAVSNLAYEHSFYRAYFETIRESIRLFGDDKLKLKTLKEVLGSALLALRGELHMWRWMGEVMRGDFSHLSKDKTKEEKEIIENDQKGADDLSKRDFKSFVRSNGNNISGALSDYYNLVDYSAERYGNKVGEKNKYSVSPDEKKEALRLIKEKYSCFQNMQAVKDCLLRNKVKGLPSI